MRAPGSAQGGGGDPPDHSAGLPEGESFYADVLVRVHDTAFGELARETAPVLVEWLREAGLMSGTVVDLGCGSGVLARHVSDAGYDVLGIDVSPAMIDLARAAAPAARFHVGSCFASDLPPCIAIAAMGETLTYFAPDDPSPLLPAFFRRACRALHPGGIMMFDLLHPRPDEPMNYTMSRKGEGWEVDVEVTEDLGSSCLTRTIHARRQSGGRWSRSTEVHTIRIHDPVLVTRLLETEGFDVETWNGERPIPLGPRRSGFVARRPPR